MTIHLGLTDDQIRAVAPSVFANAAHASRSDTYGFINTAAVLAALRQENFVPMQAFQQKVRKADRQMACKHLLRFHLPDVPRHSLVIPELVAINAHDGTAAWHLWFGVFRIVCANGLIAAEKTLTHIRIQHQTSLVRNVVEASLALARQAPAVFAQIESWQQEIWEPEQQLEFAEQALRLRWPTKAPITARELLMRRRVEDQPNNRWITLNVVQENLQDGGQVYTTPTGKQRRTRAVRAIDTTTALNVRLWELAAQIGTAHVPTVIDLPAADPYHLAA